MFTNQKISANKNVSNGSGVQRNFFSRQAQARNPLFFQAKLTVGPTDDVYEREADAVADKVMRMTDEAQVSPKISPLAVQRKCEHCMAEEDLQRKPGNANQVHEAPSIVNDTLANGGHSLDGDTRSFMESRFGYDFSGVKIHTGTVAAKSAQSVNALAYTSGNNIVFNQHQYSPATEHGRRLLAHELTHVVQQSGAPAASVQRQEVTGEDAGPDIMDEEADVEVEEETTQADEMARGKRRRGSSICAAGACPQGKQSRVIRNDCAESEPDDKTEYITLLEVNRAAHELQVSWSHKTGKDTWPCSPHPSNTPRGKDVVGKKCRINHTNLKKDGMAWFTGFKSEGLRIGFHNSQPVGSRFVSHGCVRVCCDKAEIINKNSWSGTTKIAVK
jgi:hypothetical protein